MRRRTPSWVLVALLALIGGSGCSRCLRVVHEKGTSLEIPDEGALNKVRHQCSSPFDEHRLVGEVVEIDRQGGLVKLQTHEGVRVVHPSLQVLAAIRVGDTISVTEGGRALSGPDREKQDQVITACLAEHGYRLTRHHDLPCGK